MESEPLIYLDHNATTPVDGLVLEAMLPFFSQYYGNAASRAHAAGWQAETAVETAREQAASLIGAAKEELIFTSGATESCNLAIKGVFEKYKANGTHIVAVATEHKAVLDVCQALASRGAEVTYIPVDHEGLVDPEAISAAITDRTILVCVMLANNETGVIQPLAEISRMVRKSKALLFCDATQAVGKIHVDVQELGVDLLCFSAHKFYGPKGVGALYVKRRNPRVSLEAQMHGGGHERGLRSGTLNVPGIVGLGKACELAATTRWDDNTRISALRSSLEHQLLDIPGVRINGSTRHRLYNTSNLCFAGRAATDLIPKLSQQVCVSSGSACSSAAAQASHVLKAMGLSDQDAFSSIRFSLGKHTSPEEIEVTVALLKKMLL